MDLITVLFGYSWYIFRIPLWLCYIDVIIIFHFKFLQSLCITTTEISCKVFWTVNKGNNKITELRTILQRESQNS